MIVSDVLALYYSLLLFFTPQLSMKQEPVPPFLVPPFHWEYEELHHYGILMPLTCPLASCPLASQPSSLMCARHR